MLAKSTGKLTTSQKILSCNGVLTRVKIITDGTNVAKIVLFDTLVGMTDSLLSTPGLIIGSTPANVATVAFEYLISGTLYTKAAVAAGTAPGNDVIPQNKYGAVALDIGGDGTIDVIEAADNATGYNTAALAIAGITAAGASHLRLGTVTVIKTDGNFTFGTTSLAAVNSTVVYTTASFADIKRIDETSVVGASLYGGGNITVPIEFTDGLHCSISGTGAAAFIDYI